MLSGNEAPLAITTLTVLVFFKVEIVSVLLTADAIPIIFKLTNIEHKRAAKARTKGTMILVIARIVAGFVLNIVEAVSYYYFYHAIRRADIKKKRKFHSRRRIT